MTHCKIGLLLVGSCFLCLPGSSPASTVNNGSRNSQAVSGTLLGAAHGSAAHVAAPADGEPAQPNAAGDPVQPTAPTDRAKPADPAATDQPAESAAAGESAGEPAESAAGQPAGESEPEAPCSRLK